MAPRPRDRKFRIQTFNASHAQKGPIVSVRFSADGKRGFLWIGSEDGPLGYFDRKKGRRTVRALRDALTLWLDHEKRGGRS